MLSVLRSHSRWSSRKFYDNLATHNARLARETLARDMKHVAQMRPLSAGNG